MARRQKNLLEAFRQSGVEKHTPKLPGLEPPAPRRPLLPKRDARKVAPEPAAKPAAGPFASDATPAAARPERPGRPRRAEPVIPRRRRLDVDPRRLAILGGVLAVLAIVFALGQWLGVDDPADEVRAGGGLADNGMLERELREAESRTERTGPAGRAGSQPAPAAAVESSRTGDASAAGDYYTEDDRAFFDPNNLYTVRVIQFNRDERGQELAWECYYYLRDQGLPAITPLEQGSAIMIYVGASSNVSDLERLAEYVSGLPGPPPRSRPGEFQGAYRVNIEDQVDR